METTFLERLASFSSYQHTVCGWSWANAGFMYSPEEDVLYCVGCRVELPPTTSLNPIDIIHHQICPHSSADVSTEDMASEDARLRTFRTWPIWAKASPSALAHNGFYYIGSSDRVKCVFCRGILRNWLETDVVWREHKTHFPNCPRAFDIPPAERSTPTVSDERLECKICMSNEINSVFLDCGHCVSCIDCAIRMDLCPICRKVVRSTVRIYF